MSEPAELSAEDRETMRRLQKEIRQRYFEIARIMERALGEEGLVDRAMGTGGRLIMALKPAEERHGPINADSYYCIEVDGGAWEDPPGICRPGGCS